MTAHALPNVLTSYDFLKSFALLTMVIDHIGMVFFPEQMWWRAIGRISFPIWIFLIGYARSRDIPAAFLIGAGAITLTDIVVGQPILALDILVTITLTRLLVDRVMAAMGDEQQRLWWVFAGLTALVIPTLLIVDYGALALLIAAFGYMVRHWQGRVGLLQNYMVGVVFVYIVSQIISFEFSMSQVAVMVLGVTVVFVFALKPFRPQAYETLQARIGMVPAGFLRFCGRHTLVIYVAHLVLFKLIALMVGLEGYGFLQWSWIE